MQDRGWYVCIQSGWSTETMQSHDYESSSRSCGCVTCDLRFKDEEGNMIDTESFPLSFWNNLLGCTVTWMIKDHLATHATVGHLRLRSWRRCLVGHWMLLIFIHGCCEHYMQQLFNLDIHVSSAIKKHAMYCLHCGSCRVNNKVVFVLYTVQLS